MKQLPNPCRIACLFAAVLISMAALFSCSQYDDTDIRNSINDLQERIDNLEKYVQDMQSNIEALQEVADRLSQNVTADSVKLTETDGCIIYFSDGTEIVLQNGTDGADATGALPPSITIIEEDGVYYWGYIGEDGEEHFFENTDGKIPCTAPTPKIRVNNDNYWEISFDGGLTWTETEIPASGEEGENGDSFINYISHDENYFYIYLVDDYENPIVIPMTTELNLTLDCEQTEYFTAGETKEIGYTMTGSGIITFTKPNGWKVSIDESVFSISVTAPAAENTYAELTGTVGFLLVGSDGSSYSTGLNVAVDSEPAPVLEDPKIGDYFYSDGTWSTDLDAGKTVAGVVFWVGDPSGSDPLLQSDFPGCTHGLAVAAVDCGITSWQSNYSQTVTQWINDNGYDYLPLENSSSDVNSLFQEITGYNNTQAMIQFNEENPSNTIDLISRLNEYVQSYGNPDNTSGWYCPSMAEVTLLVSGETASGSISGNWSSSMTNIINPVLETIPGASRLTGYIWSTAEEGGNAWPKETGSGYAIFAMGKGDQMGLRLVLAF